MNTAQREMDDLRIEGFGPFLIELSAWTTIKRAADVFSTGENEKEVAFALAGYIDGEKPVISEAIQLAGRSEKASAAYYPSDLKKIEEEVKKDGMFLLGILHTHPNDAPPEPSDQDKVEWLSLLFELDHPVANFILSAGQNTLSCYRISNDLFKKLKDAFEPVKSKLWGEKSA